ncbi:MAG: hypothetical protein RLZZ574_2568 [Cyanobacteriota bacterium]|jgi:hypothetical protein
MTINPTLKPTYKVIPVDYVAPKIQGNWVDIYQTKNRFVVSQYLNEAELESGVVICATGAHPIHGYTRVSKPVAAGSKIVGISQTNPTLLMVWDEALTCFKFPVNSNVNAATGGDLYMHTEVPVEVGDKVYFRHTVDGAKNRIGAIANAAGVGLELLPNAIFAERMTAPGKVAVSLLNV